MQFQIVYLIEQNDYFAFPLAAIFAFTGISRLALLCTNTTTVWFLWLLKFIGCFLFLWDVIQFFWTFDLPFSFRLWGESVSYVSKYEQPVISHSSSLTNIDRKGFMDKTYTFGSGIHMHDPAHSRYSYRKI